MTYMVNWGYDVRKANISIIFDDGRTYLSVRGEILRPLKDELQRRHSPRIPSSIKNQSVEIEDD